LNGRTQHEGANLSPSKIHYQIMKAFIFERTGEPSEVLSLREIAQPTPGPGEVLVGFGFLRFIRLICTFSVAVLVDNLSCRQVPETNALA
jgi:hypothetical protein